MTEVKQPYTRLVGISLIVLGILAIITPYVAGKMVILVIGGIMSIAGISFIMQGINAHQARDKWFTIILGAIALLCGVLVLGHPLFGLTYLALLLAIYFIIEGVWKIIMSLKYRHIAEWIWMLLTGLVSLVLGLMIWNQWPVSSLWFIGILVGVNLLATGISMVLFAGCLSEASREVGK